MRTYKVGQRYKHLTLDFIAKIVSVREDGHAFYVWIDDKAPPDNLTYEADQHDFKLGEYALIKTGVVRKLPDWF